MNDSTREDLRPGFTWYPADWMNDPGLKRSNHFEKGLWMDILCEMFFSPVRGALLNPDGTPIDNKTLAHILREPEKIITNTLNKLITNGVARVLDNGWVVNWRMYHKDKELSQKRREAGSKGMAKRWVGKEDNKGITKPEISDNKGITNDNKHNLSKEQKNIEVESLAVGTKQLYLEFVYLSLEEVKKLGDRFGKGGVDIFIERLNGYIGQIGEAAAKKKYVSHYHTILNWARKDEKEGKGGTNKAGGLQAADGKYASAIRENKGEDTNRNIGVEASDVK